MYSPDELKESVLREISRLLSTRCGEPMAQVRFQPRTVINYGMPDHAHLSPFREEDRRALADAIQQAISAYEPRLRNVNVESVTRPNSRQLQYRVRGNLLRDTVLEPVSFELEVDDRHTPPILVETLARSAGV